MGWTPVRAGHLARGTGMDNANDRAKRFVETLTDEEKYRLALRGAMKRLNDKFDERVRAEAARRTLLRATSPNSKIH